MILVFFLKSTEKLENFIDGKEFYDFYGFKECVRERGNDIEESERARIEEDDDAVVTL